MARSRQNNESSIDRRSAIQSGRDLAMSNRATEVGGLGVAAGAMILGALLPHRSAASDNLHHQVPDALDPVQSEPAATSVTAGNSHPRISAEHNDHLAKTAAPDQAAASGHGGSAFAAIVPAAEQADHRHGSLETQPDAGSPDTHEGGASAHAVGGSLAAGLGTATHDAVVANHAAPDMSSSISGSVSHTFDAVSGTLADAVSLINEAASSVSQSVTGAWANLSATIGDLAHSLSDPLDAALHNPIDSILHNPVPNVLDEFHVLGSPAASVELPSPAMALLGSIPASLLGGAPHQAASDGVLAETFGSSGTSTEMHPSIASFGDLAQPIHVGFAGQPFDHVIDAHAISTHGLGSILHGFV